MIPAIPLDAMIAAEPVMKHVIPPINVARQARDALPFGVWQAVPLQVRGPVDAVFAFAESWDREIGRAKQDGRWPG